MNKLFSVLLVLITVFFVTSCEKERGAPEACINTGSVEFKTGKSIRFMNCSKNYDATSWIITDDMSNVIFTESTDTLKHLIYNFAATGNYNVNLTVYQGNNVDPSTYTQTINVGTP